MPKHIQMGTGFATAANSGGTTTSSLLDSGVGSNDSQGRTWLSESFNWLAPDECRAAGLRCSIRGGKLATYN